MSKFGFIGPSYTAGSNAVADEECINFYAETIETPGAQAQRSYFGTPGLLTFAAFADGPVRGQCWTGDRPFVASSDTLYEVFADGTTIKRMDGTLDEFGGPVSMAFSSIELFIVAGGRGYCYNLAANTFNDVTAQLAGGPVKVRYSDGYFIVMFANSNKFQISAILDGNTWPGIQVNAVSVFPENIVSIEVSHRELWVFGNQHAQPYQDSGTDEIFDVIPGALIETGAAATFGVDLVDNTVFWISQDIRGGRQAWRASGYTPQRISTHAVETALSSYSADQIANLVSYSYQDAGHLFWVLYIPNTDCTWVYDVAENLWHKRAEWDGEGSSTPDRYEYTNATAKMWMLWSRPLENGTHNVTWSNFQIPAGKALPADAVIVSMNAVIVASGVQDVANLTLSTAGTPFVGEFTTPFTSPVGMTFPSTEIYASHNFSTNLGDLPTVSIGAALTASTFTDNFQALMDVTGVGMAICYTSATPQIDPAMPPPFPVPAGQGLAWALPSTATNNQNPAGGLIKIISSAVAPIPGAPSPTISYVLLGYDPTPILGPAPLDVVGIGPSGLIGLTGALNNRYVGGHFIHVTGASAGPPLYPDGPAQPPFTFYVVLDGGTWNSPFTVENGLATTATADATPPPFTTRVPDTGAVESTAATATFIPGVTHVPTFTYGPHPSWNHVYAFGKHLVGDWQTGNLYDMSLNYLDENGALIRRLRRSPTLVNEMAWVYHSDLTVDFATGLGPQPPLLDGDGNPRPPQAMLRWSNNRGSTWSNQHIADCGFAGEYNTRVIWRRLGRSRYRVYEVSVTDPIRWSIVDAYLRAT